MFTLTVGQAVVLGAIWLALMTALLLGVFALFPRSRRLVPAQVTCPALDRRVGAVVAREEWTRRFCQVVSCDALGGYAGNICGHRCLRRGDVTPLAGRGSRRPSRRQRLSQRTAVRGVNSLQLSTSTPAPVHGDSWISTTAVLALSGQRPRRRRRRLPAASATASSVPNATMMTSGHHVYVMPPPPSDPRPPRRA